MVMGMMALQCGVAGIPALDTGRTRVSKALVSPLAVHKPVSGIRRSGSVQLKSGLVEPLRLTSLSQGSYLSGQSLGLVHRRTQQTLSKDLTVEAKAYEAGAGAGDVEKPEENVGNLLEPVNKAPRLKIGIYFVTWWTLNVVFNIYNKKVLNVFPFPWLTSTLSLAAGVTIMSLSWLTGLAEKPDVDAEFWKALAPVALAHTIGHVAATISMSKVAVSFTHIIKSAEPAFSVIVQRLLFSQTYSSSVYLSLLPIIGGCALAAATELNFNTIGFVGAMVSNIAFVFRNIFSKKGMVGKNVGGMNYYACLSVLSLAFLTPFAFAVEGPKAWSVGWGNAVAAIGPQFAWWVAAQSIFYHLYNQVSYMSLNEISPLTFSIGNTMKRVSVIVASIIIFHTPVRPINGVGAFIAIFGTFLYSQAKQ
jgi:solute carrier family 35 protein E1